MRAWCYVAGITLPAAARAGVKASERSGGLLVRGRFVRGSEGETRPFDRLVATQAWLAATSASTNGTVYLVTDSGIRCVRAPCPSLRASTVNTTRTVLASGLDLSGVPASPALKQKAQAALRNDGLLVAGTLRYHLSDVTPIVVASQFFLAAS